MQIDKELIKNIAENSRLKLTEEEIEEFLPQLKEVIEAFSKISEVDTKDTEPSFQPIKITNVYREDTIKEPIKQEDALKNVKESRSGFIKGPKAI